MTSDMSSLPPPSALVSAGCSTRLLTPPFHALLGGLMAGGLEGVCLGVECGLTRGYTRAAEVAAHRAGLAEARRRPEWVAQAEAAEAALQAALNMSPGRVEELRSARSL